MSNAARSLELTTIAFGPKGYLGFRILRDNKFVLDDREYHRELTLDNFGKKVWISGEESVVPNSSGQIAMTQIQVQGFANPEQATYVVRQHREQLLHGFVLKSDGFTFIPGFDLGWQIGTPAQIYRQDTTLYRIESQNINRTILNQQR